MPYQSGREPGDPERGRAHKEGGLKGTEFTNQEGSEGAGLIMQEAAQGEGLLKEELRGEGLIIKEGLRGGVYKGGGAQRRGL